MDISCEWDMNCSDGVEGSTIQEFYRGANVFITGATGFVGKVLIEKLLRSCPDIGTIYMLVRSKKGRTEGERLDELISAACFDRLRRERPDFRTKLIIVPGDISEEGLGISAQNLLLLAQEVNIVFHIAATVNFNQQLNSAIKQNVRATRDLLVLCKTFVKIKSVVYVSTAYSNCSLRDVKETFYEPPMNFELAIKMAETMAEPVMDSIAPQLLGKWPNSYTFTKALAEDVVKTAVQDLPIGMCRPALVCATLNEPLVGWTDKHYGVAGVISGIMSGYLRTMQLDESKEADVVPCDMVVNGLICAAWDVAQARSRSDRDPIYNFVKPENNSCTYGGVLHCILTYAHEEPLNRAIWYPMLVTCKGLVSAAVCQFFLHTCPSAILDTALCITGNTPKIRKAYRNVHAFTAALAYFTIRDWRFEVRNAIALWGKLSGTDKALFPFTMTDLNYEKYIRETLPGIREHLLKEGPDTLPSARRRHQRLRWLHQGVKLIIFVSLVGSSLMAVDYLLSR